MPIEDPIQFMHENVGIGLFDALALILNNSESLIVAPTCYMSKTVDEVEAKTFSTKRIRILCMGLDLMTRTENPDDAKKVGEVHFDVQLSQWRSFVASLPEKMPAGITPEEKPAPIFDPTWMTVDRKKLADLRGGLIEFAGELREDHPALAGDLHVRNVEIADSIQEFIDESGSPESPMDPITFSRTMLDALSREMREELFNGYCKECSETHGRCECEPIEPHDRSDGEE